MADMYRGSVVSTDRNSRTYSHLTDNNSNNRLDKRNFSTAENATFDAGFDNQAGEDPVTASTLERSMLRSVALDMDPKREFASPASVAIIGYITFVGDSARGLVYPALWPLCESLGGNKVDLGWLVAMFSIGRLVISTRLGIFADYYRHRLTLSVSSAILIVGACIWANSPSFGSFGLIALYCGQFVMGLGTGSLGVTRSYISEQTPKENRTYQLARLSSLQYAGFAMTPLVGAALVVGGSQIASEGEYALPAYLVAFLGVLSVALLLYPFQDIKDNGEEITDVEANRTTLTQRLLESQAEAINAQSTATRLLLNSNNNYNDNDSLIVNPIHTYSPPPPHTARTADTAETDTESKLDHISNSNSNSYTLTPESSNNSNCGEGVTEGMNQKENENNVIVLSDEEKEKLIKESIQMKEKNRIYLLMMFLNFTTRGAIAIYEAQSSQILLGQFGLSEILLGTVVTCAGSAGTVNFIFFKEFWCENFSDMTMMIGGILLMGLPQALDIQFGDTERYSLWRFLLPLFLMYSIGYPVGNSAVLGSFSKLQKTNRQSKAQGQFAFMGSLARIVFPIISGYLEQYIEETSAFSLVLLIMSFSILLIIYFYWQILYYTCDEDDKIDKNKPLSIFQILVIGLCAIVMVVTVLVIFDAGI